MCPSAVVTVVMKRRTLLARGSLVGVAASAGCLSTLTGGGNAEFRPAVESFNRGVDEFEPAVSTMTTAADHFAAERWTDAAGRYVVARDGFDAAAREFERARTATSGRCTAVHDRAVRQYRRSLAFVEACDHWATAATAHAAGNPDDAVEARARTWDSRAAEYPAAERFDPEGFSCRG